MVWPAVLVLSLPQSCRHRRQTLPFTQVNQKAPMFHGALHIYMIIIQQNLSIGRVFPHFPIGITGGEVGVIQYPHPHIQLICLFQNNIHIPPPAFPNEIRMGTGFHADSPNSRFSYFTHSFPKKPLFLPMLPIKWQQIIPFPSFQYLSQPLLHIPFPALSHIFLNAHRIHFQNSILPLCPSFAFIIVLSSLKTLKCH